MHRYFSIRGVGAAVFVIVSIFSGVFLAWRARADSSLSWLGSDSPSLIKNYSQALADPLPTTVSSLGNRDCNNKTVITRPSRLLQSQQTAIGCFVQTNFGEVESSWLMKFAGTNLAGQFINYPGYASSIIAIPNSSNVIHTTSAAPNGVYLYLTRSIPSPLAIKKSVTGEVTYTFKQPPELGLRDTNGQLMAAQTDSLSFSRNGKWAVVDLPNRAMVRINTETFEALPFMSPFAYNGDSPAAQTAISNDGRYAIVSSKSFGVFRIIDLSTCTNIPAAMTRSSTCESRDLLPFLKSRFEGYLASTHIRFKSDSIVELFAAANNGSGVTRTNTTLLAPGQTQTKISYIGMGDSFASGEGGMKGSTYYEQGTDIPENKCHLSQRSYPYLLRNSLAVDTFHSIACSGAVISNIHSTAQYEESLLSPTLSKWTPGREPQDEYLLGQTPDFLTLSVGGNDVGFSSILTECVTSRFYIPAPNTCTYAASVSERGNFAKLIADQYMRLRNVYEDLVKATNKKTKIYVVGYPQFIKESGGSCGVNVHLNDDERYFISKSTHYMDQVIKAAADAAGVYYLDVENALEGKNLCSQVADSLIGVNGLTEGDDKRLPWWLAYTPGNALGILPITDYGIANESYHPNSNGHIYMKDAILGLTQNDPGSFTVCSGQTVLVCPHGDGKVPLPDSSYFGSDAVSYANSINTAAPGPIIEPIRPKDMLDTSSISRDSMQLQLDYLLPGSTVTFTSHSNGTQLGSYTTNSSGSVSQTISTASLSPGIHRIYASVTDLAGEPQTYSQTVFVPGPIGDINANGIDDSQEPCGFTTASGIDADNDTIDDACDADFIPTPPTLTLVIDTLKSVPLIPLR